MTQKTYHLDCFSGLAGDMFLGACLDLGMPLEILVEGIDSLDLEGVSLESRRSTRGGIQGVRFRVLSRGQPIEGLDPEEGAELSPGPALPADLGEGESATAGLHHHHGGHPPHRQQNDGFHPSGPEPGHAGIERSSSSSSSSSHRGLREIRHLIERSGLSPAVRERADEMFCRLGEVEARIHGVELDQVHFHEVGAIDSIVDIVGSALAIEHLASNLFSVSEIVVGGGSITSAHGRLPIPAPATLALLAEVEAPTVPGPAGELLTPTGALILAQLNPRWLPAPAMKIDKQGFGLGRWEFEDRANAVRLVSGISMDGHSTLSVKGAAASGSLAAEHGSRIAVIECQIDDLSGEGLGYLQERLFDAGAIDCFYAPVQMKKGRPGVHVTLLTLPQDLEDLAEVLMVESGSLGCRYRIEQRFVAERSFESVETRWGVVRVKSGRLLGQSSSRSPEFEDCRTLALAAGVPWREVHQEALRLAERDLTEFEPPTGATAPRPGRSIPEPRES